MIYRKTIEAIRRVNKYQGEEAIAKLKRKKKEEE